jgi:hypothetical protein
MKRHERVRAQRISERVDSVLIQRRGREEEASRADDPEFRDLMDLASSLNRIDMPLPPAFGDRLLSEIRREAGAIGSDEPFTDGISFAAVIRRTARRLWHAPVALRAATITAAVIAVVAIVGSEIWWNRTVSAAEILTRADTALADMVGPGRVLYRRWLLIDRMRRTADAPETVRQRFVEEWMDGNDLRHVAGRLVTPEGQVLSAYTTFQDKGEYRPRVYFAPGHVDSVGLLSIEPTRREFIEAAARFSGDDRRRLAEYLSRGYIYEPFIGERRLNRAAIEPGGDVDAFRGVQLSLDASAMLHGVPVYKVRAIDPVRVRFWWRRESPAVWLARQETVRYVSRDTYLSLRTEDIVQHETGEHVVTSRELLETRISPTAHESDAFVLTVPDTTPVRTQSPSALLSEVAKALSRVSPRQPTDN